MAARGDLTWDVEVARVHEEVFANGDLAVRRALMGDTAPNHAHRRRLSCTVRPEEAERFRRVNREADAVDSRKALESIAGHQAVDCSRTR